MKGRLLYAVALLVLLTACGGEQEVSGAVTPSEEPTQSVTGAVEDVAFQAGEMTGGVYTNEFLGIRCTLDENWTYLTEEEIAALNADAMEALSDEGLKEAIENAPVIRDMRAEADGGLVGLSVTFENMGVLYGATMEETEYRELSKEPVRVAMEDLGLTEVTLEEREVDFAGVPCTALWMSGLIEEETPMYQLVVMIKQGNYMASINMNSVFEDITPDLVALFTPLEE